METPDKIIPIHLEGKDIIIHPLTNMDMLRHDFIVKNLFELYSDPYVIKYSPEKKLTSLKEAVDLVHGIVLGYINGNYTHFLTFKKDMEVIGVFSLISPSYAQSKYPGIPPSTWFIEYYLKQEFWGQRIIPNVLTVVFEKLVTQSIYQYGALVFRENVNSIKVLEKLDFKLYSKFDYYKDLYLKVIKIE